MSLYDSAGFVISDTNSALPELAHRHVEHETASTMANVSITLAAIEKLRDLRANWDGYGSAAPSSGSLKSATSWVKVLNQRVASIDRGWTRPHVSANEDGNVVLEWWQANKKLTIYVLPRGQAKFIKVWGADIDDEMEDGVLTEDGARPLWQWLTAH